MAEGSGRNLNTESYLKELDEALLRQKVVKHNRIVVWIVQTFQVVERCQYHRDRTCVGRWAAVSNDNTIGIGLNTEYGILRNCFPKFHENKID